MEYFKSFNQFINESHINEGKVKLGFSTENLKKGVEFPYRLYSSVINISSFARTSDNRVFYNCNTFSSDEIGFNSSSDRSKAMDHIQKQFDQGKHQVKDWDLNESSNQDDSFERWKKALHVYDTSDLDSTINRHDKGGKQPTDKQDRELSRIFRGSKLTSRFIMRSDFGRWKSAATKSNYEKDCKEFGQSKVDELVDDVLSIYEL